MPTSQPISIEQSATGYRYSTEPFLLSDFVMLRPHLRILDIGTGSGVIPLLLLNRENQLQITGVEIQETLFRQAQKNIARSGLTEKIEILLGDFAAFTLCSEQERFDLIISNPPYRKIKSGRINPDPVKAIARHEIHLNLEVLLEKSIPLLKPEGRIVLAYPYIRLEEVIAQFKNRGLPPCRVRLVHGSKSLQAKFFLVEAIKSSGTPALIEDSVYIYQEDGSYSPTMEQIYASFNYSGRSHRLRKK